MNTYKMNNSTPNIFDKTNETEPGVGGEIQLTDALQSSIQYMESHSRERPMT